MEPYVAMGMPSRSTIRHRQDRLIGAAVHAKGASNIPLVPFCSSSSLINHSFNNLWTCLHNLRRQGHEFTHYAILHDDILPDAGWLHTLLAEMDRTGVDFLQALAPIKDDRLLLSTALHDGDIWDFERLTVTQTLDMPETVTDEHFARHLLLNTGCCLLRLRPDAEWVTQPRKFAFQSMERIDVRPDGDLVASVVSEDWLWTDKLRQAGAKLGFTRKVGLVHEGDFEYRNDGSGPLGLGRWDSDKAYEKRHSHEDQVPEGLRVSAEQRGELAHV